MQQCSWVNQSFGSSNSSVDIVSTLGGGRNAASVQECRNANSTRECRSASDFGKQRTASASTIRGERNGGPSALNSVASTDEFERLIKENMEDLDIWPGNTTYKLHRLVQQPFRAQFGRSESRIQSLHDVEKQRAASSQRPIFTPILQGNDPEIILLDSPKDGQNYQQHEQPQTPSPPSFNQQQQRPATDRQQQPNSTHSSAYQPRAPRPPMPPIQQNAVQPQQQTYSQQDQFQFDRPAAPLRSRYQSVYDLSHRPHVPPAINVDSWALGPCHYRRLYLDSLIKRIRENEQRNSKLRSQLSRFDRKNQQELDEFEPLYRDQKLEARKLQHEERLRKQEQLELQAAQETSRSATAIRTTTSLPRSSRPLVILKKPSRPAPKTEFAPLTPAPRVAFRSPNRSILSQRRIPSFTDMQLERDRVELYREQELEARKLQHEERLREQEEFELQAQETSRAATAMRTTTSLPRSSQPLVSILKKSPQPATKTELITLTPAYRVAFRSPNRSDNWPTSSQRRIPSFTDMQLERDREGYSTTTYSSFASIPTAYSANSRWRLDNMDLSRSRPSSLSGGGGGSRTSLISRSANSSDLQRRNHQPRDYSSNRATTDYSSPRYVTPIRKDSLEDKLQQIGSGMSTLMKTSNGYQRLKPTQPGSSQYPQRVVGTTWDGNQRIKNLESEFPPWIDRPKISNNLAEENSQHPPPRAGRPKSANQQEEYRSRPQENQHSRFERTKLPNNMEEDCARRPKQEDQCPRIDRAAKLPNNWEGYQLVLDKHCGIGLYNPMNNCFLNSILQAVLHLPQLARAILESKDGRMCSGNMDECFHCELQKHLRRAIRSPFPLNPDWIQPFLRKIFPQHRNGVQEDAHEMLILLLSALEPLEPQPSKQTPYGLKNHGPTRQSTSIEQIFSGSLRNKVVCNHCNFTHTNYEHIRELNLGLTRNDYSQLSQLIDDFFNEEQLQNFHCSMCQKMQTATRHTFLLSAPSVLIIQLKRFNTYGGKNCTPVHANPQLNLTNYSDNKEHINYKLHGVIEHIGGDLSSGHYICAMRGFDDQFYLFNDSDVKRVNYNYVAEKPQPYILFYTPMTKEEAAFDKEERTFLNQALTSPFVRHRERLSSTSSNPSGYRTPRTQSSTRI